MSLPLLILRPEPGATATAARATAMGITPIITPIFDTRAIAWDAPSADQFDAMIITSANAARHGGAGMTAYHDLPLLAVGDASAVAAKAVGFTNITAGAGDAAALVALAAGAGYRRLLHLCGHVHRTLDHPECQITAVPVYAVDPVEEPQFPHGRIAALAHSPRAAGLFANLIQDRSVVDLVAISAAAGTAAGPGWHSLSCASAPTDAAMLAIAARICKTQFDD